MRRRLRTTILQSKLQLTPAWTYLPEFREVNKKLKAKQKKILMVTIESMSSLIFMMIPTFVSELMDRQSKAELYVLQEPHGQTLLKPHLERYAETEASYS